MAAEKRAAPAAETKDTATPDVTAVPQTDNQPADLMAGFPGPERFDLPIGQRERIECHHGFKAVVVPEMSLAIYRQLGWRDAFHSKSGRADAGIVKDEVKFQTDPGGRLMRDRSYVMVMRPDTHARLVEREKTLAREPMQSLVRSQKGTEGKTPEFFAVAYGVEQGVRPQGAVGPLVRDDD